jgi:hypothetical protein
MGCRRICCIRAEQNPLESSLQQARIKSSSGLKMVVYDEVGSGSRDGAGCGKVDGRRSYSRSSDLKIPIAAPSYKNVGVHEWGFCVAGPVFLANCTWFVTHALIRLKTIVPWSCLAGIHERNSGEHYAFRPPCVVRYGWG